MKRKHLIAMAIFTAVSMTACSANGVSETSQTSSVTNADTQETTEKNKATTVSEETPEPSDTSVDYSAAKSQIDDFYEYLSAFKSGLIKDDREANWLVLESFLDYKSGGSYDKNWKFYVVDEEQKQYFGANTLYSTNHKDETMPVYDNSCRIGNGTFKIYAIYQNDEAAVFFFAEDEVVIDDSAVCDYDGRKCVCYNLPEMIGEDFTAFTYQLNHQ